MTAAIEFENVDILFARQPGRDGRKAIREAIAALDAGGTRTEIQDKHGVIVGVADASLSVARGEISVLMGLSGSGKSTLLRAANGLNPGPCSGSLRRVGHRRRHLRHRPDATRAA
jgi:glycine betaine/proline transport system ATP-binding protein